MHHAHEGEYKGWDAQDVDPFVTNQMIRNLNGLHFIVVINGVAEVKLPEVEG